MKFNRIVKDGTKILFIAVLTLFSNASLLGQGIGESQKTVKRPENFEHIDCGFSYPFPGSFTLSTWIGYSPYRELGEGKINQFWSSVTRYDIGCIDLDDPPREMKKDKLISLLISMTKAYLQDSPEFIALATTSVNVYEFETKTELQRRIKYILQGNRIYIFIASTYGVSGMEEALKLFNSVKYFSVRETAEKSMQNAQKSLPQSPALKLSQTDAAFNNLKGRVRSVRLEDEDVPVLVGTATRRIKAYDIYDQAGNLLKDFWFQQSGYPTSVTIYGFVGGARVSDLEMLGDETSYGLRAAVQGAVELPPADLRYKYHYEYKYDNSKRLIERKLYDNRSKLTGVYIFTYKDDWKEEKRFSPDGKLISTKRWQLDKNGNELKYEFWWYEETDKEEETYEYKKFDSFGNWTERRVVLKITNRELIRSRTSNEFRTITYYGK